MILNAYYCNRNIYKPKKIMADQNKKGEKKEKIKILKAQTFQLPPNTILLLNKYAKKENVKKRGKGERAVTKQGIVNEAILEKVSK